MNNKIAINTYLSAIESKKETKQWSRTETDTQIQRAFWWLPEGRGVWENGCKGEGIKKYKLVVTE